MSMRVKLILAVLLLLVAAVAGDYLCGWLLLRWFGQSNQFALSWQTWPGYLRALDVPAYAPYVLKIKIVTVIGFGLCAAIYCFLIYILFFKTSAPSLHGDARFATASDLKKRGC